MGSVSIQDNLHVLTSGDVANIQRAASNSTLDVTVIIDRLDSRDQLDQRTHAAITRPTTIAIGIDPDHRYTRTNFGTGTGIAQGEYASISTSGNMDFKAARWGDGVVSIIQRAQSSARVAAPAPVGPRSAPVSPRVAYTAAPPPPPVEADHGIGFWGILFWMTIAGLVGFGLYLLFRRRPVKTVYLDPPPAPVYVPPPAPPPRAETIQPHKAYYVAPPPPVTPSYIPTPPPAPVYVPPPVVVHQPAPVYVAPQTNDLALGMMLGESLGEARAERRVENYVPPPARRRLPDPEPDYAPVTPPAPPPPPDPPRRRNDDYDAGGSSTTWDPPSFDAGGSSSSFDSPSFDSGGSGGDF